MKTAAMCEEGRLMTRKALLTKLADELNAVLDKYRDRVSLLDGIGERGCGLGKFEFGYYENDEDRLVDALVWHRDCDLWYILEFEDRE